MQLRIRDHPAHLSTLSRAALQAADAGAAIERTLRPRGRVLYIGSHRLRLSANSRICLVALGKAAPAMAEAACRLLGSRIAAGVVTALAGPPPSTPLLRALQSEGRLEVIFTGHPLPDGGSLAAGRAAASMLDGTGPDDVLLALVSGGGSAMFELVLPGIDVEDLRKMNDLLLRSGAPIEAINTVRRSLSLVKAGGLARLAAPARTVALILSDVVGDRLSAVASGPTILRRADPAAARRILKRFGLWPRTPLAVKRAVAATGSQESETRPVSPRPINILAASNRQVVESVACEAAAMGFTVTIVSRRMHGEARVVAEEFVRRLLRAPPPACLLLGGETTVTVRNGGRGGRNQELALAAALALQGVPGLALMALATDGIDGPTDAAGAVVTGETVPRARALGLDPAQALARHDSYPLLDAVGALLRTGPTGTNLGDLVIGLAYPPQGGGANPGRPQSI